MREYNTEWCRRKRGSTPRPIKPVLQPGEKFCFKCERILPLDHFYRCKSKPDGRMSTCKDCDGFKQTVYRHKHTAKIRQQARISSQNWRAKHPGYNAQSCLRYKRRRLEKKLKELTHDV